MHTIMIMISKFTVAFCRCVKVSAGQEEQRENTRQEGAEDRSRGIPPHVFHSHDIRNIHIN